MAATTQKIQVKPKIQISSQPTAQVEVMGQNVKIELPDDNSNPLKRKREEEGPFDEYDSSNT